MKRREALKLLALSSGAITIPDWNSIRAAVLPADTTIDTDTILNSLKGEPPAQCETRPENGGLRLYLNDRQLYPFMALSSNVLQMAPVFKKAGIRFLAPIIGMQSFWQGPGDYDWEELDRFFAELLMLHPGAYFLPRLHLNTPLWWCEKHPDEMLKYGLPADPERFKIEPKTVLPGGLVWESGQEVYEASWASEKWRRDTGEMVKAFLEHIEESPLRSRMIGYHPTTGVTGEWGYFGGRFLPDYSKPMQKRVDEMPTAKERMNTTFGLLRDPEKEKAVIDYYQAYHTSIVEAVLYFAKLIKTNVERPILCGTFYGYIMENIMMHEIGFLTPQPLIESPYIDYLAGPYSYIHTNIPGEPRWHSDIEDNAGNWLGRARGVGGDGAYRLPVESLRRHNKLFIVEMDANTYLDPQTTSEGGSGKTTLKGTLKILKRDMGQMFASGNAGWLYDFGPMRCGTGWYSSDPIVKLINTFVELGKNRIDLNISSVARVLGVMDPKSFMVSQHWSRMAPYKELGSYYFDFINHWFHTCQMRTWMRMSAPMDFVYAFDLQKKDTKAYDLFFIPNLFYADSKEVKHLKNVFRDSGATVVWYYAPGFVNPERLDLRQMETLTGFSFEMMTDPGPMMIQAAISGKDATIDMAFGVSREQYPRFVVKDDNADILGYWADQPDKAAMAMKKTDGYTSVYTGTAPLPVEIVRRLATGAGVKPWSSVADIIYATEDIAMLIATQDGKRTLNLPKPMAEIDGGEKRVIHELDVEFGEVLIFTA